MKSYVADVNSYLNKIIKTHDSLLMVSIIKYLADKLKHVFSIRNRIEGVLESSTLPKQVGETAKGSDDHE